MLLESKSLLAKLMATENLVVEQRKVSTAFFDTQSRVLVIPILDNNIPAHTYDLFMGHEVGHALWTPADGHVIREKNKIPHSLANVVEDSRIERKIKYKYPGLKNSFMKGYKDLFDRNFFETQGRNVNTLKFIDRLNLHCKIGALLNISFTESEKELVREVESTETYTDVIEICQKIIEFTKENLKNQQVVEVPMPELDEFDEDEDDISDLLDFNQQEDDEEVPDDGNTDQTEEEENFDGTGEVKSESQEESEEMEEKNDESFGQDELSSKKQISELLESDTDKAYRDNEHKLFSEECVEYIYANIPKFNPEDAIVDFKEVYEHYDNFAKKHVWLNDFFYDFEGFKKIRDEIKTGVSYLVKEFEMRKSADQLKKSSSAKTGDLNMSKIYSHQYNEDIFKKITVMPGAKSHGLVIFVDWSGSMIQHLENTVKQLFNIVMFCKKVNIPYEVYSFTTRENLTFKQNKVIDDILIDGFVLMNVLSSRMNASQFTKAAAALVYSSNINDNRYRYTKAIPDIFSMGGTPLNQVIVSAMEIVPAFQRKYKLQVVNTIFLTDGDGDCGFYKINNQLISERINPWNYKTNTPNRVIVRDTVTKHQEKIELNNSKNMTAAYINLFKYRTKCNIVGFYILSPKEFKSYLYRHCFDQDTQDIRANFSKNHCAVITNDGFDEYYLLRSKKGDSEEPELVVKENASSKVLATAFSKYNTKRNTNRIVLNSFINMIS